MSAAPLVILNVDDTEAARYAKGRTLRHAGFEVVDACSGADALDRMAQALPALVLLDVRLPDISGIELCRTIKQRWPTTMVLQTSAFFISAADRTRGLDGGADAYLVQPIDPDELVATARALLRLHAAETRARELNETLERRIEERTRELDAANRRLTEQMAQRERAVALVRRVADSIPGLITYWDTQQYCRFANEACLTWLGTRPEQLMGLHLAEVTGAVLYQEMAPCIQSVLQGRNRECQHERRAPDGSTRHTLASYVAHAAGGTVQGFIIVETDVTALKRAKEQLAVLNEELTERARQAESATRAKTAFLAHMSHEIRTPLNAVIGLSQLLRQMDLPERAGSYVNHIQQAGEQLLGLTDDVLDLSRIEVGEMRLEQVAFALVPLVASVHAIVEPQAAAKGLALDIDLPSELPQQLQGDPLRLKQVLLNLLSNAVKFTPAGRVALHVLQLPAHDGHTTLRFEVIDTGIGIAPEQLSRVFDPFTQADSSTTRRFGGSGLGLSIVQRLVDMMGGELALHSTPGQGSTFSVTVGLELAAADPARP